MEIQNHKEEVPVAYYEEKFQALDPAEVTERLSAVQWDGSAFAVKLLGREFAISHPTYAIAAKDGGSIPPLPTQTFLLRYLLECKDVAWNGAWKTFGRCLGARCTSSLIRAECLPVRHLLSVHGWRLSAQLRRKWAQFLCPTGMQATSSSW